MSDLTQESVTDSLLSKRGLVLERDGILMLEVDGGLVNVALRLGKGVVDLVQETKKGVGRDRETECLPGLREVLIDGAEVLEIELEGGAAPGKEGGVHPLMDEDRTFYHSELVTNINYWHFIFSRLEPHFFFFCYLQ